MVDNGFLLFVVQWGGLNGNAVRNQTVFGKS